MSASKDKIESKIEQELHKLSEDNSCTAALYALRVRTGIEGWLPENAQECDQIFDSFEREFQMKTSPSQFCNVYTKMYANYTRCLTAVGARMAIDEFGTEKSAEIAKIAETNIGKVANSMVQCKQHSFNPISYYKRHKLAQEAQAMSDNFRLFNQFYFRCRLQGPNSQSMQKSKDELKFLNTMTAMNSADRNELIIKLKQS